MWLGVLSQFLKPIVLALIVLALFLPLYSVATGRDAAIDIGKYTFSLDTIMNSLTELKFEPFLFNKVIGFVDYLNTDESKLGAWFAEFKSPTGNSGLDTFNQLISFVFYDGIKIALTISAYILLLIDFALFLVTSVLSIFGNITGLFTL